MIVALEISHNRNALFSCDSSRADGTFDTVVIHKEHTRRSEQFRRWSRCVCARKTSRKGEDISSPTFQR